MPYPGARRCCDCRSRCAARMCFRAHAPQRASRTERRGARSYRSPAFRLAHAEALQGRNRSCRSRPADVQTMRLCENRAATRKFLAYSWRNPDSRKHQLPAQWLEPKPGQQVKAGSASYGKRQRRDLERQGVSPTIPVSWSQSMSHKILHLVVVLRQRHKQLAWEQCFQAVGESGSSNKPCIRARKFGLVHHEVNISDKWICFTQPPQHAKSLPLTPSAGPWAPGSRGTSKHRAHDFRGAGQPTARLSREPGACSIAMQYSSSDHNILCAWSFS